MTWRTNWPLADGHADTLTALEHQERKFWLVSERGHLDLPRLCQAGIDLQVMAVCAEERSSAADWAQNLLSSFSEEMLTHARSAVWLREREDWKRWETRKLPGVLLALEGLEPLEGDPGAIEEYYQFGVRMASLAWNHTNPFAGGALEKGGLTAAGREVIRRMGELGMVLDVSHLNKESFWQVIREEPTCPVLASHSNAFALCQHPRNLDDDQIRALSDLGGTVGVALYPPFLTGGDADVDDVIRHILHIQHIGGMTCPALGCDFDGIRQTPKEIRDVTGLPLLYQALSEKVASPELAGVLGANLRRVLQPQDC